MELLQRDGHAAGEVQHLKQDGASLSLWITATCVRDAGGDKYVRVFTDISLLKETQRQLERMASFDGLTGLPNRRLLHHQLVQTLRSARRNHHVIAVLFIDLDGFKTSTMVWDMPSATCCCVRWPCGCNIASGRRRRRLAGVATSLS